MKRKHIFFIINLLLLSSSASTETQSPQVAQYDYFPRLENIFNYESILHSIQLIGGFQTFDYLFYVNYEPSISADRSNQSYKLILVTKQKVQIKLTNSDFIFTINPNNLGQKDLFPTQLSYNLKALTYIRDFEPQKEPTFSSKSLYRISFKLLGMSDVEILLLAVDTQLASYDLSFKQLVKDINSLYGSNIQINETGDHPYTELANKLDSLKINPFEVVYELYIKNFDEKESKQRIEKLFSSYCSDGVENYVKKMTTPEINVKSEKMKPSIEFPTKILRPTILSNKKSTFQFGNGNLNCEISKKTKLEFSTNDSSYFYKSFVGGKRILLDLVTNSNIVRKDSKETNNINMLVNDNGIEIVVKGDKIWNIICPKKFICQGNNIKIYKQKGKYYLSMDNPTRYLRDTNATKLPTAISKITISEKGHYVFVPTEK